MVAPALADPTRYVITLPLSSIFCTMHNVNYDILVTKSYMKEYVLSKFTQAIVKPHKGRWIALFALTLTALVSTPAVAAVEPGDSVYIGDSTGP